MAQKFQPSTVRLVWRMTDANPMGSYVDRGPSAKAVRVPQPEVVSGNLVDSSFDLLQGTDVSDNPDTLSPELLDELFGGGPPT